MHKKIAVVSCLATVSLCAAPFSLAGDYIDSSSSRVYVKQEVHTNNTSRVELNNQVVVTGIQEQKIESDIHTETREAFKEKLKTITDEKKKEIVEKLDTHFAEVNKNITDHLSKILDRLAEILTKIQTRATEAKSAGKDTSAVEGDITTAQSLIASAKTAVATQAAKQYTITITTEGNLRMDVGKTASSLHTDLRTVKKAVIDVKQAVMKAASDLAHIQQ